MAKVQIGSTAVELKKNEAKEIARIGQFVGVDKDYAQRSADIWMRSAPAERNRVARQAAVRAIGLSDEIKFS